MELFMRIAFRILILYFLAGTFAIAQGTPAISCPAGQFMNSQYLNTGQSCGTPTGLTNGTVTTVSVVPANGVSGTVATSTTTPAITLSLGAITPTSTNGVSAATMAFVDATSSIQTQLNATAPSASPTLTGTPLSTTAAVNTNTTQIATTAFVVGQAGTATPIIDGTGTVGSSLLYARQDHIHPTDTSRAPLASPALTGVPTAPTAAAGTATTQIATTAFVNSSIPLVGVTPSIGGSLIVLGCTNQTTVTITGATTAMVCTMSGAGSQPANTQPQCFVSAANTVTPQLCTSITLGITPTATVYNIRILR